MVETQAKNQNIFWLWSDEINFQKRGDTTYWSPELVVLEKHKKSVPLNKVAQIKGGKRLPLGEDFSDSGKVPYIRTTDFTTGYIDYAELKKISEKVFNAIKNYQIYKNDVLISIVGTIGAIAILDKDFERCNFTENAAKIVCSEKLNPYYLYTFLISSIGQQQLKKLSVGGVQPKLPLYAVEEIKILLPDKQTQQKVEQIVKDAFQLKKEVEKERREADLILENSIKGFFATNEQKAFWKWSTDIEIIKTLEPNFWKKTISSKKHPTIEFGDIFNYQKGTEVGSALYQDSGISFLRVSDLGDLEIQLGNSSKCINETLFDELKDEFQPHKGELLFSKDATIGLVAKVETEEKQIISSGILRLQIKNKDFDPDFLMALLTNKFVNQEFVKNSTGSVIKHLNTQKLSEIELPLVDKQIQREVASRIKSSISKRHLSKQKLQEAKDFVENLIKNQIIKVKK